MELIKTLSLNTLTDTESMKMKLNDVTISGVIFAHDEIQNPRAYVRGTFREADKIEVTHVSGRAMSFRVNDTFDLDSLDFTNVINHLTYGNEIDSNICYEICFSPKVTNKWSVPV